MSLKGTPKQLTHTMTKWELFAAFSQQGGNVITPNGKQGIIQSITRESGCGRTKGGRASSQLN